MRHTLACTYTLTHTQSAPHTHPHTHSHTLSHTQHNTYLPGGQDALIAITDRMVVKARKVADEEAKAPSSLGSGWVEGAGGMNCVGGVCVFVLAGEVS